MKFPESELAHRFLDGRARGLEIGGAAQNPFGIPGCWNLDYTRDETTAFKQAERETCGETLRVDVVGVGDDLPFRSGSLDYVIASHVIEHLFDPIGAIEEWMRVLRPGGIVFCIVPHKVRTFDKDRPRTSAAELLLRRSGRIPRPAVDDHGHHSVWVTEDFLELCRLNGWPVVDFLDEDDKAKNGFAVVLRKPEQSEPEVRLLHGIYQHWSSSQGLCVAGWVLANEAPVEEAWLATNGTMVRVKELTVRGDVNVVFPMIPAEAKTGFKVYLPGRPGGQVTLVARTAWGITSTFVELPEPKPLPYHSEGSSAVADPYMEFVARVNQVGGTVVEVGSRRVSPCAENHRATFSGASEFIGFDLHPDELVDCVGDAHQISRHLGPASADHLFSLAVLEHLAAPWLFAAEVNRVLRVGGLTFHVAPPSWPLHELPADYWRFSDEGLKVLFGPATGFEVLGAGMYSPFLMAPTFPEHLEDLGHFHSYGGAFVLARKVREIEEGAVRWPIEQAVGAGGRYPGTATTELLPAAESTARKAETIRLEAAVRALSQRVLALGNGRRNGLAPRGPDPFPNDHAVLAASLPLLEPRLEARDRELRRLEAERSDGPRLSIVVPVFRPNRDHFLRCLESVRAQTSGRWELCLCDDGSGDPWVTETLTRFARSDRRIRWCALDRNGGISRATNAALELATGEYVGFLDHDDEIHPAAVAEVLAAFAKSPEVDLVYTDEDKINVDGSHIHTYPKYGWSPDLLLTRMYLIHFMAIRRALVEQVGGLRSEFDGSQDHDLALRVTEIARRIEHVPRVLYHWRISESSCAGSPDAKPWAYGAARRALADALRRRGEDGRVEDGLGAGLYRVRRTVPRVQVDVIIPTRDAPEHLARCIASLERSPGHEDWIAWIVDNGSAEPETRALLWSYEGHPRIRVLRYDEPFNWSAINNWAAKQGRGEALLFLNDDVEGDSPDWLAAMLEHVARPDIGVVGAKLVFPDGRLQHGGVVIGLTGIAGHMYLARPADCVTPFCIGESVRDCSAVTGACLLTRRDVFESLGGFDERLGVAFNDADYCLRSRARGLRVIYTPHAQLIHRESASRGYSNDVDDLSRIRSLRAGGFGVDPFFHPLLTLRTHDLRIAGPDEEVRWP